MSFYQDLYQYSKERCPVICIYSDLSVETYIDIPIREIMRIFSMGHAETYTHIQYEDAEQEMRRICDDMTA